MYSGIIFLSNINQMFFVMEKYFFVVRSKFLLIIWTSFGYKGLVAKFFFSSSDP